MYVNINKAPPIRNPHLQEICFVRIVVKQNKAIKLQGFSSTQQNKIY